MNTTEKIDCILKILDIKDYNSNNIIDNLCEQINKIQKILEYNTILIQEMIKSDLIPPIILKKTQLCVDLKSEKHKLSLLINQYDISKSTNVAQEIINVKNNIETMQEKIKFL